jgi:1-acyl-sn-glycerol-3-phosphate acyltransferase
MRYWGRGVLFIFSMELSVKGPPPTPPFFIVSNHLSYIDIPIYAAVIDTTFVSKSEIRHWPLVGWMAHMLGIIFINRKLKSDVKRVNNEITEAVENQGVLLFPEATTSPGTEILRFRSSLLEHAAEDNLAVSVAAIRYETEKFDMPAYESVCWWGDSPLHTHLLTLGCTCRIKVEIIFSEEKFSDSDRKNLAAKLEKKMKEMFVPVADTVVEDYKPVEF